MSLSIYSLNTQGLKNSQARVNVLKLISKFKPIVICLQETNIDPLTDQKLLVPNYNANYNASTSRFSGTAIFCASCVSVLESKVLYEGKLQLARINFFSNEFIIFNIHIPHVWQEAHALIEILNEYLARNNSSKVILCGDWNYVENPDLDSKRRRTNSNQVLSKLKRVFSDCSLKDSFRQLFPGKIEFTYCGNQSHKPLARLDRIYLSLSEISHLVSSDILPSFSDHKAVRMILNYSIPNAVSRFSLKPSLLTNNEFLTRCDKILTDFINNPIKSFEQYEVLKWNIRKLAVQTKKLEIFQSKLRLRNLKKSLSSRHDHKALFQELVSDVDLNLNCDSLLKLKCLSNSQSNVNVQSAFGHLPLNEISKQFTDFFTNKFACEETSEINLEEYLKDLPKLRDHDISFLKSNFNQTEILKAIDELKTETSPGLDGLTSEFYKKFKTKVAIILEWLWDETLKLEKLPESSRCGLISLLYKKNDPSNLKNWRPIIMSNSDYKVFAIIMKNRMSNFLSSLIGGHQTCNIKGRSIYDNLSFLSENINDNVDGAILSIDQESAFDNISHQYLKSLKAYNFPDEFINYIRILYNDSFVHVNFGCGLSNQIPVKKGVKQGDPMASTLYVLCIEPLLIKLSSKLREIAPSPFPTHPDTNLSAYADDTACIISEEDQFHVVRNEFQCFGSFSGSKINRLKSELYPFGNWVSKELNSEFKVMKHKIKVLGIYLGRERNENWSELLDTMKLKLQNFKNKFSEPSLLLKAKILNTFILPVAYYKLKVLHPNNDFISSCSKLIMEYLWESGRHWIKKFFVFCPSENGGLGIIDVYTQHILFKMRGLMKAINVQEGHYFLDDLRLLALNIFLRNSCSHPKYDLLRTLVTGSRITFSQISQQSFTEISLNNPLIFNEQFPILNSINVNKIGDALNISKLSLPNATSA